MQLLLQYKIGECANCGEPIYYGEVHYFTHDDEMICSECKREHYHECHYCGELFDNLAMDYVESLQDYVCCECFEDHLITCACCNEMFDEDDIIEIGGSRFCISCSNHFSECSDCGCLIDTSNDEYFVTHDDRNICCSCYNDFYATCPGCDDIYHQNDVYYCEADDCYYCENCSNNRDTEVFDYHRFCRCHEYFPHVCAEDKIKSNGKPILLYGVELECDRGDFHYDSFKNFVGDDHLIHFEHDGSLSCDGVECISQPCSLRFHQKEMKWNGICETLLTQGFKSHNTSNCGLHIHISREAITPITISKLDIFINRSFEFMRRIARRDNFYRSNYNSNKIISKAKGEVVSMNDSRYQAVNTSNNNTVEIRIFRGTLKYSTLIGTIEFCDSMVRFLEYIPISKIYNVHENILRFIDWCGENYNTHPHIIPMMSKLCENTVWSSNIEYWVKKIQKQKNKEVSICA